MTRYIDASPAQRFYQYTLPAAKKAIATGYKEIERQRIAALVADQREQHAAAETDRDRKKANRRIRACLDEWKNVCRSWEADNEIVAKA
tara:strand:- start:273 stop:539 length:267 start_codon:yes stop_codon:yes gene_type:complete